MKNLFLLFSLLFLQQISFAQFQENKFRITGAFGLQQYAGDLGNGFYQIKGTKYGVATLSIDYSINSSFSLKAMGTLGDLGIHKSQKGVEVDELIYYHQHGQHHHHGNNEVVSDAHGVNAETENLNSRMASGILAIQFNFSNGKILPIDSKVSPYVYIGAGINRLTDRMEMGCVKPGLYSSANLGGGFQYYITNKISAGIQLSFGRFNDEDFDFFDRGKKDYSMQNSISVAYSL